MLESVSGLTTLRLTPPIDDIAKVYIDHYLMPRKHRGDARHLAYASFYKMTFLLTWNCNHLANGNKKSHLQNINARFGLHLPEILTPLQLFKEPPDDN